MHPLRSRFFRWLPALSATLTCTFLPVLAQELPRELTGLLQSVVVDDSNAREPRLRYFLMTEPQGQLLELQPRNRELTGLRPGTRLRLDTIMADGVFAITPNSLRVLSFAGADHPPVQVVGARRIAVLLLSVPARQLGGSCSKSTIERTMYSGSLSVDKFYRESSFGQLSLLADSDGNGAADIFGPFNLDTPAPGAPCDIYAVASRADAAATTAGVDLPAYDHVMYVLPNEAACGHLGELGCREPYCRSWIAGLGDFPDCMYPSVFAHEIGHNLGMHHAATDLNADGVFDQVENGDTSDVMGMCCLTFPQPNAPHKYRLGWWASTPGRVVDVPFGGGPYTFTLLSTSANPASAQHPQLLRLAGEWYLSTRSAQGFDSNIDTYDQLKFVGRTSVHRFDPADPSYSSRTFLTSLLRDGESFADAASGYRVTQLSHTSNSVTVQILPPGECTADEHTACLLGGRFKVQIDWRTANANGLGTVMEFSSSRAETDESSFWWFFSPSNFEIGMKVLDGCALNGSFWVFVGGLTNQAFTLRVTDTLTGFSKSYENALGHVATTVTDTSAFPCD